MRGLGWVLPCVLLLGGAWAKHKGPHYKVHCTKDNLRVDIVKHEDVSDIYLQHLKDYPDPACKPEVVNSRATFNLKLSNIYQCMVTKVVNKNTGRTVYYHRVVMEYKDTTPKQAFMVKCDMGLTPTNASSYDSEVSEVSLVKRQADFPVNFQEDSDIEITSEVTGTAPIPVLNVGVRQDGTLIDEELNVKPGTPLNMEVYLDSESAGVYGLMVTGMEVTDTREQTEPILVNGCSVDPYLFENFVTNDGDYLKAKFRAFKFPESSFVLFKGTVNVCLDTCSPVSKALVMAHNSASHSICRCNVQTGNVATAEGGETCRMQPILIKCMRSACLPSSSWSVTIVRRQNIWKRGRCEKNLNSVTLMRRHLVHFLRNLGLQDTPILNQKTLARKLSLHPLCPP